MYGKGFHRFSTQIDANPIDHTQIIPVWIGPPHSCVLLMRRRNQNIANVPRASYCSRQSR